MTREQEKLRKQLIALAVCVVGLALIVRGVALAWRPGGFIVAGLFIALPALAIARAAEREK